jgi:hypothetical protein
MSKSRVDAKVPGSIWPPQADWVRLQVTDRHELLDHGIDLSWDFELVEVTGPDCLAHATRPASRLSP